MSGEPAPVLRHIELPAGPGTRLTIWVPAGSDLIEPRPLAEGSGFTIDISGFTIDISGFTADAGGGRWRTELKSWSTDADGTTLELEIRGRYPE